MLAQRRQVATHREGRIGDQGRDAQRASFSLRAIVDTGEDPARLYVWVVERLGKCIHRAKADLRVAEQRHPLVARAREKDSGKRVECLLALGGVRGYVVRREIGALDAPAELLPELPLQVGQRHVTPI